MSAGCAIHRPPPYRNPPLPGRTHPPMAQDAYDALEIRCPQLGGPVAFAYCRKVNLVPSAAEGEELPCRNLLGCWRGRFDVVAFLRATYTDDQLRRAFAPRDKTRLQRLVELAQRARDHAQSEPDPPPTNT